ncbi:MAG: ABC transporter permease [Planctomycetes bacterium]|nr:ABC transporter permease [Planctomycetota bacterium]
MHRDPPGESRRGDRPGPAGAQLPRRRPPARGAEGPPPRPAPRFKEGAGGLSGPAGCRGRQRLGRFLPLRALHGDLGADRARRRGEPLFLRDRVPRRRGHVRAVRRDERSARVRPREEHGDAEWALRRLLQGPVTRGEIVLGKSGAVLVMGVVQATVMFLAAALLFGVRPNGSYLGLGLMILLTASAAAALAMFLAAVGESEGMVHGVALLVILVMSALGGSMFPLVFMPAWMQQVAGITLNKWAIDGFNSVVWRGQGLTAVLPNAAVLLVYSAALFLLGRRMFRWKI